MIIFENDFLNLNIDENDILVVFIKENSNCNKTYIIDSIESMIEGIKNTYTSYQKLNKPLGLLFDARHLKQILPLSSVWNIAKFFGGTKDITEEIVVGSAIITGSDLIISLVNAFSKLYQNVKPMKFTKDLDEGCTFLKDLFNEEHKNKNIVENISPTDINNLLENYENSSENK